MGRRLLLGLRFAVGRFAAPKSRGEETFVSPRSLKGMQPKRQRSASVWGNISPWYCVRYRTAAMFMGVMLEGSRLFADPFSTLSAFLLARLAARLRGQATD